MKSKQPYAFHPHITSASQQSDVFSPRTRKKVALRTIHKASLREAVYIYIYIYIYIYMQVIRKYKTPNIFKGCAIILKNKYEGCKDHYL